MQQLRRITDRVARTGQAATDQVAEQLAVMSKRGNKAAKSAYGYVMNHPKSATAVVLGTAMAAGLLWFMQRNVYGKQHELPYGGPRSRSSF